MFGIQNGNEKFGFNVTWSRWLVGIFVDSYVLGRDVHIFVGPFRLAYYGNPR